MMSTFYLYINLFWAAILLSIIGWLLRIRRSNQRKKTNTILTLTLYTTDAQQNISRLQILRLKYTRAVQNLSTALQHLFTT